MLIIRSDKLEGLRLAVASVRHHGCADLVESLNDFGRRLASDNLSGRLTGRHEWCEIVSKIIRVDAVNQYLPFHIAGFGERTIKRCPVYSEDNNIGVGNCLANAL